MDGAEREKIAQQIIELFEDILDEHQMVLPDETRQGEEEEAAIYGETYFQLESAITEILYDYEQKITQKKSIKRKGVSR